MAQVTFFHYIHQETVLHRMDGRLKLGCLFVLTFSATLASGWLSFLILLSLLSCGLVVSKLPLVTLMKEMKLLAVMLIIVFLTNGFHFASRLILMMLISVLMSGTTSLTTVKNTIEWYLRPIPFIPEVRIATMINLTFVLIPMIFDNYLEMTDAQKARCVTLRKNPIRRIKWLVFPLLSRTLRRADELIYAMEARCYSETRTRATFKPTHRLDWLILALCLLALILVAWYA
ncbi:MAG: energy-coupling factor transporter transmembrane protein EcfT [Defluviitaleaceae bacterium]|nr:energy-coupling factor transporter transmembrane protein EcfT [Defluviitaleaceae bacterium]